MSGWHPIETAPNWTPVLVWSQGDEVVSAMRRKIHDGHDGEVWQWHTSAELFECFYPAIGFYPTHWQPLPDPPHDP